jgi:hypothetical protein
MNHTKTELSRKRAEAGRRGGYARFFSIKRAGMAVMGRLIAVFY